MPANGIEAGDKINVSKFKKIKKREFWLFQRQMM